MTATKRIRALRAALEEAEAEVSRLTKVLEDVAGMPIGGEASNVVHRALMEAHRFARRAARRWTGRSPFGVSSATAR